MKRWIVSACLFAMVGTASLAAAESPFIGTWKLNQEKSHLTGSTLTFSPADNGMVRETEATGSYTFKTDGQPYQALFGDTNNWKQTGSHTWQTMVQRNGKPLGTDTWTVSADGRTLTDAWVGKLPNGKVNHETEVYKRTAGDSGLMGTWKSTSVKTNSPEMVEFAANGQNGITWILPSIKARLEAQFDGKDYVPTGPTVPKGLALAFTKTGPDSFRAIEKLNGKPLFKMNYKVSPDGKTLTAVSTSVNEYQPETAVYDKQ